MAEIWRVGHKLGRTPYVGDAVVGMVDTPELAARIVAAMNTSDVETDQLRSELQKARGALGAVRCSWRADIEGHSADVERCQLVTGHGGPHYHEGATWTTRL